MTHFTLTLVSILVFVQTLSAFDRNAFAEQISVAMASHEKSWSSNISLQIDDKLYDKNGKLLSSFRTEIVSDDLNVLARYNGGDPSETAKFETIFLYRPDGCYTVSHKLNESSYMLDSAKVGQHRYASVKGPYALLVYPATRFGIPYSEVFGNPNTSVTAAVEPNLTNGEGGSIEFTTVRPKGKSKTKIVFSTENELLISSMRVDSPDEPFPIIVSIDYITFAGSHWPGAVRSYFVKPDGSNTLRSEMLYSKHSAGMATAEDFSLEKYGLPEHINFHPHNPQKYYYIWILAAGVLFALAITMRIANRRRRKLLPE
jgi:hypothetical protein